MSRSSATRMLVSGVALGILAGFAIRRTLRPLAAVHIAWLPLLMASLVARAVAPLTGPAALVLYISALAGTAVAAAANVRFPGAALIALGGALNLVVVLLNQGMPVDSAAIAAATTTMPTDPLHVAFTGTTRLGVLADVIPLAIFHSTYSVGDVCIAAGGFVIPFVLLIRR